VRGDELCHGDGGIGASHTNPCASRQSYFDGFRA
jgi:hypothetical protein